jgi:LemA protein
MRAWFLACVAILVVGLLGCGLSGCGYSSLTRQDEDVKAAWSEVVNQYQRRADLIPNLVRTVKGYANQEQQVLIGVTEARAKAAGSIQLTPELLNNPDAFARFQAVQGQLSTSLKSLFAVAEAYPDLKSNENFRDLQVQLEGTENRITVARQRYIEAVAAFNSTARALPNLLTAKLFDFQVKPNFTVADEQTIAVPPSVDFGPDSAPGATPESPRATTTPGVPPPATGAPPPGATAAPPAPGPGAPAPK